MDGNSENVEREVTQGIASDQRVDVPFEVGQSSALAERYVQFSEMVSRSKPSPAECPSPSLSLLSDAQKHVLSFEMFMSSNKHHEIYDQRFQKYKQEKHAEIRAIKLSMEEQKQSNQLALAKKDETIQNLIQEKASLKESLIQKNLEIADINITQDELSKRKQNFRNQLKNLSDGKKHLITQNITLDNENKMLRNNVDQLTAQNTRLTEQNDELSKQHHEIEEELKDTLIHAGKLCQEKNGLETSLTTEKEARAKLQQESFDTIERFTAEQQKVENEKQQNEELHKKIHHLKNRNVCLEEDKGVLTKTNADLLADIKDMEENNRVAQESLRKSSSIAVRYQNEQTVETPCTTPTVSVQGSKRMRTEHEENRFLAMELWQNHSQLYQQKGNLQKKSQNNTKK